MGINHNGSSNQGNPFVVPAQTLRKNYEGPEIVHVNKWTIPGIDGPGKYTFGDCRCGKCMTREERDLHSRIQNLGYMLRDVIPVRLDRW